MGLFLLRIHSISGMKISQTLKFDLSEFPSPARQQEQSWLGHWTKGSVQTRTGDEVAAGIHKEEEGAWRKKLVHQRGSHGHQDRCRAWPLCFLIRVSSSFSVSFIGVWHPGDVYMFSSAWYVEMQAGTKYLGGSLQILLLIYLQTRIVASSLPSPTKELSVLHLLEAFFFSKLYQVWCGPWFLQFNQWLFSAAMLLSVVSIVASSLINLVFSLWVEGIFLSVTIRIFSFDSLQPLAVTEKHEG